MESPARGFREAEPPDAGEIFKNVKTSKKNLNFLKDFQEYFAVYSKIIKILSNFWREVGKTFRKFRNMRF